MATDNPVLAARSAVAHAVRSGDPEAITSARDNLRIAKADRLRSDAAALLADVQDRTKLRVIGYGDPTASTPSRADHDALYQQQYEETVAFRSDHPNPSEWTKEDHAEWTTLLDRHTAAHVALGCAKTALCRMARG